MASQNDLPGRAEVDSKTGQVEEPAGAGKKRARVSQDGFTTKTNRETIP